MLSRITPHRVIPAAQIFRANKSLLLPALSVVPQRDFAFIGGFDQKESFYVKASEWKDMPNNKVIDLIEKKVPASQKSVSGISGDVATELYTYGTLLGSVSKIEEDLNKIHESATKNGAVAKVLNSNLSFDQQSKILDGFFNEINIQDQTRALFKHLDSKNLLWLLPRIIEKFRIISKKEKKLYDGQITTVEALSPQELETYKQKLIEKYLEKGANLNLTNKVDASILGGVKVRIEDREYDGSKATQLAQLRVKVEQKQQERKQQLDSIWTAFRASTRPIAPSH